MICTFSSTQFRVESRLPIEKKIPVNIIIYIALVNKINFEFRNKYENKNPKEAAYMGQHETIFWSTRSLQVIARAQQR
jgi:hypothetical protein